MRDLRTQAWRTIQELNRSWTSGHAKKELRKFFHHDVIALISGNSKRIEGIDACAEHWRACFEGKPDILWEDFDPKIRLYGEEEVGTFAIVACKFKISWLEEGQHKEAVGNDIFTLKLEGDEWLIVSATV